jgi:hypothetical protein
MIGRGAPKIEGLAQRILVIETPIQCGYLVGFQQRALGGLANPAVLLPHEIGNVLQRGVVA